MTPPIRQTMGVAEWAMLLTLGFVWGGSFFFNAVAVAGLPVITIVAVRVALAAAFLWLVVAMLGIPVTRDRTMWLNLLAMGVLNNVIPFSLIVWGQGQISSSLASVLNATTPFFTLAFAHLFTRDEALKPHKLLGIATGICGVAVMVGANALHGLWDSLAGQLAVLGAACTYGIAGVFGRRLAPLPPLVTAAGQTAGSSLVLVPLALAVNQPWTLPMPGWPVVLSLIGLALPCTALAYILFFSILKRAGAANVSLVTFLVPVSAILLGTLILGDVLEARHIAGMAAIALGLVLIDGRLWRRILQPA